MSSKIYPIGIQNFEKIRKDGYFYIDKTALIYQMVKTGRDRKSTRLNSSHNA